MIKYVLTENQMPKAWYNIQAGRLVDTEYSANEVAMALAGLPVVD